MPDEAFTDADLESVFSRMGYIHTRRLESGEVAGLAPMMFTMGLCVGLDEYGYRTRYCYDSYDEAKKALDDWDGYGHPSDDFIKQKGDISFLSQEGEVVFNAKQ